MSSIFEAANTNDRLAVLVELRNKLAVRLDQCESNRDLAALSRQFVQVVNEIDEIMGGNETKAVSLDDFRNKLKAVK